MHRVDNAQMCLISVKAARWFSLPTHFLLFIYRGPTYSRAVPILISGVIYLWNLVVLIEKKNSLTIVETTNIVECVRDRGESTRFWSSKICPIRGFLLSSLPIRCLTLMKTTRVFGGRGCQFFRSIVINFFALCSDLWLFSRSCYLLSKRILWSICTAS